MAHKQVNALVTLSGIAGDDLIPVFDSSEIGDERLKKYTVQELKTDLTSMDPSAFGNWVPYIEKTFNNEPISGTTFAHTDGVTYRFVIDGFFDAAAYIQLSLGGITGGWNNVAGFTNNGYGGAPTANNKIRGEWVLSPVDAGLQKLFSGKLHRLGTSIEHISAYNSSTVAPTSVNLFEYRGTTNNFTGTYKVYKWQEVKPIELHSYELVKEYTLSNEAINDTFDWDGEADPDFLVMANLKGISGGGISIYPNNDTTASNYSLGLIQQDGTSTTVQSASSTSGWRVGAGAGDSGYLNIRGNLSNIGNPRSVIREASQYVGANTDSLYQVIAYRWENTTDDITSFRVVTDGGGSHTGSIKFYKLAKAHLFNQTIYNNLTLNVATTGSDVTGDGTTQKPFASIGGAVAWLRNKTINTDVTVTIKLADGTYNLSSIITIENLRGVVIDGNLATPANTVIAAAPGVDAISYNCGGFLTIKNLKFSQSDKSETAINSSYSSCVYLNNCIIDGFHSAINVSYGSTIRCHSCTLSNNNYGIYAARNGIASFNSGSITGNAIYGAMANYQGRIVIENTTMSGNDTDTSGVNNGLVTVV